jgi:hypothetical protein
LVLLVLKAVGVVMEASFSPDGHRAFGLVSTIVGKMIARAITGRVTVANLFQIQPYRDQPRDA